MLQRAKQPLKAARGALLREIGDRVDVIQVSGARDLPTSFLWSPFPSIGGRQKNRFAGRESLNQAQVCVCAKTHGAQRELHVLRLGLDEFDQLLASVCLVLYGSVEHVKQDQRDGTRIGNTSLIRKHVWGRRLGLGSCGGSGTGVVGLGLAIAELPEGADVLRMSVFGNLEIILAKVGNRVTLGICDDHIDENSFRGDANSGDSIRAHGRTGLR